jgi:hypothetical protein
MIEIVVIRFRFIRLTDGRKLVEEVKKKKNQSEKEK